MHFIIIFTFFYFITNSSLAVDTKADQAVVIDYNTNEVLFEKKSTKKSNKIISLSGINNK